jgi:hypothetical protein
VQRAKAQLQEAQQRLNDVQTGIRLVGQAVSTYRMQAQKTTRSIASNFPNALSFLTSKIADLQAYLAGGAASASTMAPVSSSTSTSAGHGAYGGAYGSAPHLGIQMIPLDQIDLSDSWVTGAGDFKKTTPQALIEAYKKLQDVVIPAIAKGAGDDYFARLDASLGLQNADSYLNVYNVFYGSDAISIEMVGKQYKVVGGGFHRLFIAQKLGIHSVPAKVVSVHP